MRLETNCQGGCKIIPPTVNPGHRTRRIYYHYTDNKASFCEVTQVFTGFGLYVCLALISLISMCSCRAWGGCVCWAQGLWVSACVVSDAVSGMAGPFIDDPFMSTQSLSGWDSTSQRLGCIKHALQTTRLIV